MAGIWQDLHTRADNYKHFEVAQPDKRTGWLPADAFGSMGCYCVCGVLSIPPMVLMIRVNLPCRLVHCQT